VLQSNPWRVSIRGTAKNKFTIELMEDHSMNEDVFSGQWKQMRGELKSWWGKLADDELDLIGGHKDKLIALVQERYGYARDHAEQEVERRFKEFGDKTGEAVASITAKAQEFGATAGNKANEAAAVVGEKIGSLANVIREKAPHDGAVATAATTVVDGLESASAYLREKKFNHLAKDVAALVRTYPLQSLLVGVGLGYLLARRPR
jgi:uncharacterized protein YjbJ (UPF0337 family)